MGQCTRNQSTSSLTQPTNVRLQNLSSLLSLSPKNRSSYDSLLNSVAALSLDHESHKLPATSLSSHPRSDSQSALDSHLHSIRSTSSNFSNRFFDKPYTILVDPLARAGATGEHSPCDALVPSIVAEYAIVQGVEKDAFDPLENTESPTSLSDEDDFLRLDWVADQKLLTECQEAKRRSIAVIQDSDDTVFWFDKYGTDFIKTNGRFLSLSCLVFRRN
jgi:carnitine O-acetyltransferase